MTPQAIVVNLLSGALGAFLVVFFQAWMDVLRVRAECLLAVVDWSDQVSRHLAAILVSKSQFYERGAAVKEKDQYEETSRKLTELLHTNGVSARIVLTFGEGDELELLSRLQMSVDQLVSQMRDSTPQTWAAIELEVRAATATLDRQSQALTHRLLVKARPSVRLWRWLGR